MGHFQEENGTIGKNHHYHGLSPTSVIKTLASLLNPELVALEFQTRRYVVVTLSVEGRAMLAVIETGALLRNDRNANVNKLVTLYEKNDFSEYLRRIEKRARNLSYIKNREPNGALIASLGFSNTNICPLFSPVKLVEGIFSIFRQRHILGYFLLI